MTRSVGLLDFPDDPAELAPWLERKLVGVELARVIAELEAVHEPPTTTTATLDDLLANRLDDLLEQGLRVLPRSSLNALLRVPRRLLELQEHVLIEGGPYWQALNRSDPAVAAHVEASRRGLGAIFGDNASAVGTLPFPSVDRDSHRAGRGLRVWATVATLAASVLAMVVLFDHFGSRQSTVEPMAWGWNRAGAFARASSPRAYFERLAKEASEWFSVRPIDDDRDAFATRLGEFRTACSRLILARHEILAPADREWLVERCRKWSESLDKVRDALEHAGDAATARAEVDAMVTKLIGALRDRGRTAV